MKKTFTYFLIMRSVIDDVTHDWYLCLTTNFFCDIAHLLWTDLPVWNMSASKKKKKTKVKHFMTWRHVVDECNVFFCQVRFGMAATLRTMKTWPYSEGHAYHKYPLFAHDVFIITGANSLQIYYSRAVFSIQKPDHSTYLCLQTVFNGGSHVSSTSHREVLTNIALILKSNQSLAKIEIILYITKISGIDHWYRRWGESPHTFWDCHNLATTLFVL